MHLFHQKLQIPNLGHQPLSRPAVRVALEAASTTGQVVFMITPAGWGKTTILVHWATTQRQQQPVCWYSLDSADRDPIVFFKYLLTALSPHHSPIQQILAQLDANLDHHILQPIIEQTIAVIAAHPQPLSLILDNAHVLTEGNPQTIQPIFDTLDLLMQHTPISIIYSSRVAFPGMTRLLIQGQARTIDGQMLAFSPDDVIALAHARYEIEVPPEQALQFVQWAGGWPAALVLALDDWSRRNKAGIPLEQVLPYTSMSHLYYFLAEQIFAPLPEHLQAFVIETAVLHTLVPEHCDMVRETNNSVSLLAELQRRDLLVSMRGDWMEYLDLFRRFLLTRLHETPARAQKLLRRAAALYQQRGLYDLAFNRWLEVGDLEAAAALILETGPSLRQSGEHATVQSWLETLQTRMQLTAPLLLLQARIATDSANWAIVNSAIQMAIITGDAQTTVEARLLEAAVACIKRDDARASDIMKSIPIETLPLELRLKGYEILSRIALNAGQMQITIDALTQAITAHEQAALTLANVPPPAQLYDLLGMALAMKGDYSAALYYLRQAESIWQALKAPIRRVTTLNNLAALAIEEGRLADARIYLKEGLELAEQYGRRRTHVLLLCGLADIALFETQFEQALASYAIAHDIACRAQLNAEQAYACVGALRAAALAGLRDEQQRWRHALDQLSASSLAAQPHLVALVRALVSNNLQEQLHQLNLAEGAPYMSLHDCAQLMLLRAQVAFQCEGWKAAATLWQKLEDHRPLRHLDALLQRQLQATPGLLTAAADTELARRLRPQATNAQVCWTFSGFGGFAVASTEHVPTTPVRPIDQLVCIRLLESGSAGLPVLILWEDVWSDHLYSADALRQSMSRIRRATGLPIQLRQGHCQLLLPWGHVAYDVMDFEAPLQPDSMKASNTTIAAIEQRLALYRGAFLSHLHHESNWLDKRRALLKRHALALREKLAQLIEHDDPQQALQLYSLVLEEDGCREVAAAGSMRCATKLGNRPFAVAVYQQICHNLLNELATDPSPTLEQIYREIA